MLKKSHSFKYKYASNKEINVNNAQVITDFRKANELNIVRIPLSLICLKYKNHLNTKFKFKKEISRHIDENIIINKPLVVNKNDDVTYNLILGYKGFVIANGIKQKEINVIVVNNVSRNSFFRSIKYRYNYEKIKILDLVVPERFAKTVVKASKLNTIESYYSKHRTLDKPITITKDNVVIDGYTRYLFSVNIGLNTVECVRISKTFAELQSKQKPKVELNIESEKLEVQYKLNRLIKFLEEKDSWCVPTQYDILEYCPKETDDPLKYVPNVYCLYNLIMEIEDDGVVYSKDLEGYLEEKMYANTPLPLQALIIDDIIYIGFHEEENKITISLDYGYIQIYY